MHLHIVRARGFRDCANAIECRTKGSECCKLVFLSSQTGVQCPSDSCIENIDEIARNCRLTAVSWRTSCHCCIFNAVYCREHVVIMAFVKPIILFRGRLLLQSHYSQTVLFSLISPDTTHEVFQYGTKTDLFSFSVSEAFLV